MPLDDENFPNPFDPKKVSELERLRTEIVDLRAEVTTLRGNQPSVYPMRDFASHLNEPAMYVNQFSCQTVRGLLRLMMQESLDGKNVAHRGAFSMDADSAHALGNMLHEQASAIEAAARIAFEAPVDARQLN